jgi:hypothetical protein
MHDIGAINDLAFTLVRQLKDRKALAREIEDRMYAPHPTGFTIVPSSLWQRRGIDQANRSAFRRSYVSFVRGRAEQPTNQPFEPSHRVPQPLEKRDVRQRGQPHRLRPGRRQAQPTRTPAISQHQPQLIQRALDPTRPFKSPKFSRLLLKQCRATKPINRAQPFGIRQ